MKILINLEEIIELDITVEQYYLLALIYFKRFDLLIKYTTKYGEFKFSDIEMLRERGLISYIEFKGDLSSITVTEKGRVFIHSMEVKNVEIAEREGGLLFQQLLDAYPKRTSNGRVLQAGYKTNRDKWMKIYFKNLKLSNTTHDQVLSAIKKETTTRTINKSVDFWSMLPTYINQGLWDAYVGVEEKKIEIYGSDFK